MFGILATIVMALCLQASSVRAQTFPSETIRIVTPFPAGSTTDVLARIVAERLEKISKSTVIVENRPGALGTIGASAVAKAKPDGYTLLLSSTASNSSAPFLLPAIDYDPVNSFTHLARLAKFNWILVANKSLGYKGPDDLAKDAKGRKLAFAYGSASAQVAGAALNRHLGIGAVAVPYKGQPEALTDLVGGRINYMMVDIGAALPLIKRNEIQVLAIAGSSRSAILPDVPTFAESGSSSFEFGTWTGLSGPASMPDAVVKFLSDALLRAAEDPEFVAKLRNLGGEASPAANVSFAQFVTEQLEFWSKQTLEAGIRKQ